MEFVSTVVLAIILILFTFLLKHFWHKGNGYRMPPCLPYLPIVGSMPFLPPMSEMHTFFMEKSKTMGNIFGFFLGHRYTIVLNGREAIYEALVKNSVSYASRPEVNVYFSYNKKLLGLTEHNYDEHFKKYHHLSLDILKKFGFGKGIMEGRIKREVDYLLEQFDAINGKDCEPGRMLTNAVSNVINSIVFGERWDWQDKRFIRLSGLMKDLVAGVNDFMQINYYPFLRWIPGYSKAEKYSVKIEKELKEFMNEQIEEAIQHGSEESFISCFIAEDGENYDREQLLMTVRDFAEAGSETMAHGLKWFLVLMANNQSFQKELQVELDRVLKGDRLPTLSDKPDLPLMEATILEVLRMKTIVPLSVLHRTSSETFIQNKRIPKGTWVMPNLYSAHMDPVEWGDPHVFRPKRFLDDTGAVINRGHVLTFSLGKRACFGEIMARQELFLFMTSMVKRYSILPGEGRSHLEEKGATGVIAEPTELIVRLVKRLF